MQPTSLINISAFDIANSKWYLAGVFRTLVQTRREMKRVSVLARRERLQPGYRRIPQRVWDRRSALFIER